MIIVKGLRELLQAILVHEKYNKSDVKRLNTLGHLDQYMAQHGRIVKQSRWRFCLIQIKHSSTRGPIPLWLYVPMCTSVETVKQSLNRIETNQGLFHSLNAHRHNAKK